MCTLEVIEDAEKVDRVKRKHLFQDSAARTLCSTHFSASVIEPSVVGQRSVSALADNTSLSPDPGSCPQADVQEFIPSSLCRGSTKPLTLNLPVRGLCAACEAASYCCCSSGLQTTALSRSI
ncbi:unnamed protein product [Pleuronectes platessa]|uniref:Uncharacterized protein n=1 Tax=Pleuronectes platessa TaxID=8262 RepID=A0A9N7TQM5_PLEPL|nr:unnamed protein product [Pleuronectes platessa]